MCGMTDCEIDLQRPDGCGEHRDSSRVYQKHTTTPRSSPPNDDITRFVSREFIKDCNALTITCLKHYKKRVRELGAWLPRS